MSGSSTRGGSGPLKAGNGNLRKSRLTSRSALGFFGYRHIKVVLFLLVILCAGLSLAPATFGYSPKAGAGDPPGNASSIAGTVSVTTGSGQANNLAGIAVKTDW